ncbi:SMAD/FHA domain-containing protein [Pilobolus umbonatus]|nr:SMAD/FHA domain-containing protein [Pilobolus umbonatus]
MSKEEFVKPSLPENQDKSIPPLPYTTPPWSGIPCYDYKVEVLKNGQSIDTFEGPKKEYITIGRLPICDINMEHPSISRYHAVLQFDEEGDGYLFDLGSAHGTKLNKKEITKKEYVPLKPGDQIKFGESTRIYIYESTKPYDPEAELEEKRKEFLKQRIAEASGQTIEENDQGISWGFQEDAPEEEDVEEEDDEENKMNLPSGDAELINVEAEKMAFEDAKRRREDLEIMFGGDSDEELYDQTVKKKAKKEKKADTHDELKLKQKNLQLQIENINRLIEEKKKQDEDEKLLKKEEDLDAYMKHLAKQPRTTNKSVYTLQKELRQLNKDNERLIKLVALTKPSDIL